jgi:tripartite-type tricarboxylate transporter receptor subunit TctC
MESGFSDYEHESWNGLLAPAKTPSAILDQLRRWFTASGESVEIKEKLTVQGLVPGVACGAEFGAALRRQYEQYGRTISAANLKVQ